MLFSAPMVRAILAGTKTQTRRVAPIRSLNIVQHPRDMVTWSVSFLKAIKGVLGSHSGGKLSDLQARSVIASQFNPYGQPGDRLWVREAWAPLTKGYAYRADPIWNAPPAVRWRPSIHMPRAASSITLEVTAVRVERLQDISEADAMSEGCKADPFPGPWWQGYRDIGNGELLYQQAIGDAPPAWMIEPKRMRDTKHLDRSSIDNYRSLWMQINGADSWDANPWVWVVEFKKAAT